MIGSKFYVLLLVVLVVSGCAPKGERVRPGAEARYRFDYELTREQVLGVVQVFDDCKETFIHFRPDASIPRNLNASSGARVVKLAPRGAYHVVEGVFPLLTLKSGARSVEIRNMNGPCSEE